MSPLPRHSSLYSYCARRVFAAALLLAASASTVLAQAGGDRLRHPVRRATSEIVVDGRVVEEAWSDIA